MKMDAKHDGRLVTVKLENEAEQEHFEAVFKAFAIYCDREHYRDGWRRKGAMGNAFQVKDKANRVWDLVRWGEGLPVDDALDIINYVIFTVRCAQEGNNGGEFWPEADQRSVGSQPSSGQNSNSQGVTPHSPPSGGWQPQGDEVRQPTSP